MLKKTKLLSILIALFMLVVTQVPVSAQDEGTTSFNEQEFTNRTYIPLVSKSRPAQVPTTYEEVIEKYGFQIVTEIPDGIEPLKVSSPEELDRILAEAQNGFVDDTQPDVQAAGFVSPFCTAFSHNPGGVRLRLHADMNKDARRVLTDFYGVRASFTGWTLGLSMRDPWGHFTHTSPNRARWLGGATIDWHIVLPIGTVIFRSTPHSCGGSYVSH